MKPACFIQNVNNHKVSLQRSMPQSRRAIYKFNLFLCVPGDNTGAVIEVTGVREGGERPHRVVTGKLRQTLHKIIQLVQVPSFL